eukprot:COSAG02_NODE_6293_length_3672_cov_2.687086_1_plen_142_part_00
MFIELTDEVRALRTNVLVLGGQIARLQQEMAAHKHSISGRNLVCGIRASALATGVLCCAVAERLNVGGGQKVFPSDCVTVWYRSVVQPFESMRVLRVGVAEVVNVFLAAAREVRGCKSDLPALWKMVLEHDDRDMLLTSRN